MEKAVFFLMTNVTIMVCLVIPFSTPPPPAPLFFALSRDTDFQREKEKKKSQRIDANGLK